VSDGAGTAGRAAGRAAGTAAGRAAGRAAGTTGSTSAGRGPSGRTGSAESGSKTGRRRRLLLAALAGLILLAVLAGGALLLNRPSEAETRTSALEAARRYATLLTTYDARTLDQDLKRVRDVSTSAWADEFEATLNERREQIESSRVAATGSVAGAGLEQLEGDVATVLVAVDQRVTTAGQPPADERSRLRLVLEQQDGTWVLRSAASL
jgi:Mce-associated membrane protein